jgi:hypothetical protein
MDDINIGRHSTKNVDDGYMGSGLGIINAIKKYGIDSFSKEIIAEAKTREDLWELESQIVNIDVVSDPQSYNVAYGGKGYLDGLKKSNPTEFINHQSAAGKIGGPANLARMSEEEKKEWHSMGGYASAKNQKESGSHPFYNGVAAVLGGKAIAGLIELWNPTAVATNKNQREYRTGDCKRVRPDSEIYKELLAAGWLPIEHHKNRYT